MINRMVLLTMTCILLLTPFRKSLGQENIKRPIGINLTGIQDWSSEYVFVDAFKMSRQWIPHENWNGAPWQSEVEIPLGPNGYPLEIPYDNGIDPPQVIRTLLFFGDLANRYPEGMYRLIASGSGQISFWGAAHGSFTCPVDTLVAVNNENGGLALEIEVSDINDPVRDIHFIIPGFHDTWMEAPFHPDFLSFVEDFQMIRFMDWMKTNGSVVMEWEDRNHPDYFSQTLDNGVAYEHIVTLCNLMKKDAWICIPHAASDDYIHQMARFLRDNLDTARKIYVEYSNEVWNGIFSQNYYAQQQGELLGFEGEDWEQGWKYYVRRTFDIFSIFEEEFEGDERLVKVLAGQAANSWINNRLVEYSQDTQINPYLLQADAFAIAPYFGGAVADAIGNAGLSESISIEAILDSMELALPDSYAYMDNNKSMADEYGMDLICYEAGQHLVASHLYNNDESYVNKLKEANRHPRMQELYCSYFDHWYDETQGGILANFSSHGSYSKWGSWGVKEYMDDVDAPKYLALKECVFTYNDLSNTRLESSHIEAWQISPNPVADGKIRLEGYLEDATINIYNLHGQLIERFRVEDQFNSHEFTFVHKGQFILVITQKQQNKAIHFMQF